MPTTYDVYAAIIEHAPCAAKDLPFSTPIYAHLKALVEDNLLTKSGKRYAPKKTPEAKNIFEIIKYSLKHNLDYNIFFSKNMDIIITQLFAHAPMLRPRELRDNQDIVSTLKVLEVHQFMLLTKLRPRQGAVLRHQLFEHILRLHGKKLALRQIPFIPVQERILKIPSELVNPFDDSVYEFLAGSAQLEGGTVTPGETRELILRDVYPDKPKEDIQMVKNLNEAMHYILEHLDKDITEDNIKELNRLVLFSLHRSAGTYKRAHNKIQGNPHFKTARPLDVAMLMREYCTSLQGIASKEHCLEEVGRIHNDLQHIHPFTDGNSRTTRMVMNWMLLKQRLPLLVLKMGSFDAYMGLTKLARERDDEQLKLLLHHVIYHEHLMKGSG